MPIRVPGLEGLRIRSEPQPAIGERLVASNFLWGFDGANAREKHNKMHRRPLCASSWGINLALFQL